MILSFVLYLYFCELHISHFHETCIRVQRIASVSEVM